MLYTASADGKVCFTDIESGTSSTVLDLNPDGWAVSSPFECAHSSSFYSTVTNQHCGVLVGSFVMANASFDGSKPPKRDRLGRRQFRISIPVSFLFMCIHIFSNDLEYRILLNTCLSQDGHTC